ncbi:MAG: four helix bundle protein [Candidatus Moraniibacteriota bacterium]
MEQFRFLDWPVYRSAQELFTLVLGLVQALPKEYRYDLGSQLVRSSFSVVLNIAEGSGKSSDKEMNRFLEISLGSLYETLAAAETLQGMKLVSREEFVLVHERASGIAKQIGGFKKKLDS